MKGWPLALLVVLPSPALAQEGAMLPLGVRVRVSTSDRASVLTLRGPEVVAAGWRDDRIVGTLARLRDDTLVVVPQGHDLSLAVPYATLGELEVSRGRHRRTGRGALIGLGIGVAGGVVAALVLCHDDRCESSGGDFAGFAAGILGVGGALAGTGLGALIGSFIHQEKWRDVSITWMRVGAAPGRRLGLSLSLPLRFP